MKVCHWCKEPLIFKRGVGWVHQDGSVYKQRPRTPEELEKFLKRRGRPPKKNELLVDDHCALPVEE